MRALFVLAVLVLAFPAPAAAEIAWQPPRLVEPVKRLRDVTCPSAALCVAVGGENSAVVVSRTETATGRSWSPPLQLGPPTSELYTIECPAENACIATGAVRSGDDRGTYALTTSNPSDPNGWVKTRLGGSPYPALECPTTSLCLTATSEGLFVSRDPFAAAPVWEKVTEPGGEIFRLECPSEALCFGSSFSRIVMSTRPGDAGASWTTAYTGATNAVSCPAASACFATGGAGKLLAWTGGPWSEIAVPDLPALGYLACPALDQCFGLANGKDALTTRTPSGGALWTGTSARTVARSPSAISCYAVDRCVIAGFTGYLTVGAPRAAGELWSVPARFDPSTEAVNIRALDCPSTELCLVATSNPERVYRSTSATGGASTFTAAGGLPAAADALTCPSVRFCVVADGNRTLTTTDPAGATTWTRNSRARSRLRHVACPTARLCVAAGAEIGPVVSTDGGRTWSRRDTSRTSRFLSVACPSVRLCIAGGSLGGRVGFIRDPARAGSRWRVTRLGSAPLAGRGRTNVSILSLACPSARLCVGLDWRGRIVTSKRPTGGRAAWRVQTLRGFKGATGFAGVGVACPSERLCVAIDATGLAAHTRAPAAGAAAWTVADLFPPRGQSVGTVSCPTETFCVAGYRDRLAIFRDR